MADESVAEISVAGIGVAEDRVAKNSVTERDGFTGVDGFDLVVHRGESVAVVGDARSTVIGLITGRLRADAGTISRIGDRIGSHTLELIESAPCPEESRCRAVADAAARKPNLIVADEPFVSLPDAKRSELLTDLLAYPSHRSAVVIATCNPGVAARCTRVVEADGGAEEHLSQAS